MSVVSMKRPNRMESIRLGRTDFGRAYQYAVECKLLKLLLQFVIDFRHEFFGR